MAKEKDPSIDTTSKGTDDSPTNVNPPKSRTQEKTKAPKVSVSEKTRPSLEDLLSRAFRVTTDEGGQIDTTVQKVDDLIDMMFSEPEAFMVRFENEQDYNVVREAVERIKVFDGRVTVSDERRTEILENLERHNTWR